MQHKPETKNSVGTIAGNALVIVIVFSASIVLLAAAVKAAIWIVGM